MSINLNNFDEYSDLLIQMEKASKEKDWKSCEMYCKALRNYITADILLDKDRKSIYLPFKINGRLIIYPDNIN